MLKKGIMFSKKKASWRPSSHIFVSEGLEPMCLLYEDTANIVEKLQGLTKRMKKVTPLFDTKIRINCYFLPIN